MALPSSYLITTKNLESFLDTIINAQAPERFTQKFLESLEFTSTNDRLFIGVLKALGFLDEGAVPTEVYYNFLDQTQSKKILAERIREAYSDLFAIKINAQDLTIEEVKNKLKTLTQGKSSDNVLKAMANTFKGLCEYAEWISTPNTKKIEHQVPEKKAIEQNKEDDELEFAKKDEIGKIPSLNYNIQIHLPETRDSAVYDAIFRSLREHLL